MTPVHPMPLCAMGLDSQEYDVLYHAACETCMMPDTLSCEIGVRQGGSSELICWAGIRNNYRRPHIAIDPFGNLPYLHGPKLETRGYDDVMRRTAMRGLSTFAEEQAADIVVFPWKDTDFFTLCANGVPFYVESSGTTLWNSYSLVFFDGPHDIAMIRVEMSFFESRTPLNGYWVFDDVRDYEHDAYIEPILKVYGFQRTDAPHDPTRSSPTKRSYIRINTKASEV